MKKPFLSAVTRQRIKNMIAYVLDHAEQLNQSSFPASEAGADPANVCGTPFCAAGHAIIATSPKKFAKLAASGNVEWTEEALKFLKFKSIVSDESHIIFGFAGSWPKKFAKMYHGADYLKSRAAAQRRKSRAFAARWQYILDNDGGDIVRA
jgi:hypothetical protein